MMMYRLDVDPDQEDSDLLYMCGIESQTDHLPIGPVRQHWDDDVLRATDAELADSEAFFRESALELCRSLIARYSLTVLFRPVGQTELDLIAASGFTRFPPRLPSQPIFYPVLTEEYAVEIARDWNTRDAASGLVGYVLRFSVDTEFLTRYPERIAGAARHRELWVPAEEVDEFNHHIRGPIETIAEFRSPTS